MNLSKKCNHFVILVYLTVSIQLLPFSHSVCNVPETIIFGDAKVICAGECIFYCIPDYYFGEANDYASNCTFSSITTQTNQSQIVTNQYKFKHAVGNMFMEMSTCNLSTASVLEATKCLDIGFHWLKLNGTKFTASDSYIGFDQITHLYLSNMPTNSVLGEKSFINLLNLIHFEISNNDIDSLPENLFINQTELKFLNLTENNLRSLPNGTFKHTKKLFWADLSHNQLETIETGTFDDLIELEALDLSYNKLNFDDYDDLQSPFEHLTKLKSLNLAENNLLSLSNTTFSHMHRLQWLDLNRNRLKHIQSDLLNGLVNLKHFNLSSNKISTLSDNFWRFNDRIYELDLSNNRLETLNNEDLPRLSERREFKLEGNPWKCECDSEFNKFLRTQQRLGYLTNVKCVNNLTIIETLDVCEQIEKYKRLKIIISSLVCGFGMFIIVVVVAVCYKNKHKPKARSKNHNFR